MSNGLKGVSFKQLDNEYRRTMRVLTGAKQKKPYGTNMYQMSAKQWNPFVGCKFDCAYCKSSFQKQQHRQTSKCSDCGTYAPHKHIQRLGDSLPKTKFMQFIFTCASGDISFCPTPYLRQIMHRIHNEPDKNFLLQSKNPATFDRFVHIPDNVMLGTTIETNRDELAATASLAPSPTRRYLDLLAIDHPLKMVTLEPMMEFDLDVILEWMTKLKPCLIWMGFNSGRIGKNAKESDFGAVQLPEPTPDEFRELHWELSKRGFIVLIKSHEPKN